MTYAVCTVDGCTARTVGRGFCLKHYRRFRKYGRTDLPKRFGMVETWLRAHMNHDGDACLIFPFARRSTGYGVINFGVYRLAHRWMCEQRNGPAPEDKPFALHRCGRGSDGCVNPMHLYWGDGADIYLDQIAHGVAAVGERSGKAKFRESDIRDIRLLWAAGKTKREIAEQIGAHPDAVRSVLRGRTWRHVS